jgi:DNA-binding CsgD family transcriptional regulator
MNRKTLELCRSLVAAVDLAVENNGSCLMAFHENRPPDILHHSMSTATAKHYLDRYLAGPYLLDPLYQLAISTRGPTACRFRDAIPDGFRSSEYYRQYYERTHLRDEMDFLIRAGDATLVLVVGRFHKRYSKADVARLNSIAAIIFATMQNIWKNWNGKSRERGRDRNLHRRLTRCLATFGDSQLTRRERQITQLLLRGHSAKSVARELRIAPGTVMVHKRNLFAKLGITSQYELFSQFIRELSNS